MIALPALSLYRPLADARYRIFAFPHAGGGASAFLKLRTALAIHKVELCPLQPPGRENRSADPAHRRIEDLAHEFSTAIESLPALPSAFLGHSLGGLVAYVTLCLLRQRKAVLPVHLAVSGSLSPALRQAASTPLSPGALRERILALGGIPDAILADPELFGMFEAIIIDDIAMGDAYCYSPAAPLSCSVTVYCGNSDQAAPQSLALAWQAITTQQLHIRTFEGGHFFLYADPERTAAALVEDLGLLAFAA
jgi:medium-chain acyl-[acyl-carrier-protein] hydrolase